MRPSYYSKKWPNCALALFFLYIYYLKGNMQGDYNRSAQTSPTYTSG